MSDQIEYLADTHQAFEAVERLVTPIMAHDTEQLDVHRSQLGCLLRVLNAAMRGEIAKARGLIDTARSTA